MKTIIFWTKKEDKVQIIQSKFIEFLNNSGFAKAEVSNTGFILVLETQNIVTEIADHKIVDYVKNYLIKVKEPEVLETFSKGLSYYVSNSKLRLLKTVELLNDKDDANSSWFFFKNICCQVEKKSITSVLYENIKVKIWESRVLKEECNFLPSSKKSQFETFCFNISGKDKNRFESLQTIIGYLLHRYQDPGNPKAIILVDEKINFDGTANGGTGKSLLLKAIGQCRKIVVKDGKHNKVKSGFKNQRIERVTDIVFYDDVRKDFSFEDLYSMITTGIPVEKKYQTEIFIEPEDAPKICVSSNYVVKGTGGNSDIRRRCDFELKNYYNNSFKPEDEFDNIFFTDWDKDEWNDFFHFMMGCVQRYLKIGLITPNPINLKRNQLINDTSQEFVSFMELEIVETDKWISKKSTLELFTSEYNHYSNLSPHQMTKWLKVYARQNKLFYEDRKSGEKYEFYLKSITRKEVSNEEE